MHEKSKLRCFIYSRNYKTFRERLKNLNKHLGENNLDKLEWYRVVI